MAGLTRVFAGYLTHAVADTVESFGGLSQHAQNLLFYGSAPSAKHFIDFEMDETTRALSVFADLHNAPSAEDVRKYIGTLGNKVGMTVTPGSNEKGHGGKAGFHADAKVAVLGAKAGDLYMLGFPQTTGMVEYMSKHPLKLQETFDGSLAVDIVIFARRENALDEAAGTYGAQYLAEEDPVEAFYDFTLKWLDGYLKSVGSSLSAAFAAAFDKLKDTNGMCVHYIVLQDHGFATQTFAEGVKKDIVIEATAAPGEPKAPLLRLSHELSDQFDLNALGGRQFRINGEVVDMRPLCPTARPVLAGGIAAKLPDGGAADVTVYGNADLKLPLDPGTVAWKLGSILLPEVHKDAGLEAIRSALTHNARFAGDRGVLVDRPRGVVTPWFLKLLLDAAGVASSGPGAPKELPWPALRQFVKDVNEVDAAQKGAGLNIFRVVFGLDDAFMVVDVGRHFPTNNNKTGLFDPMKESKKVMTALPEIWTALAANLPEDCQRFMSEFQERRNKAAADKATKAAAAKAAKSEAAEQAAKDGGAAATPARAVDNAEDGAAAGDEEHSGRGKRKAAVKATQLLAGALDDDEDVPKKKSKPAGKSKASAQKSATSSRVAELEARVTALEQENESLRAKLVAAGLMQ